VFSSEPSERFAENAFGAVFGNVGPSSGADLEGFLEVDNLPAFRVDATPTTGTNDFSFVGLINPDATFNVTTAKGSPHNRMA
jgi:hypothetical protein